MNGNSTDNESNQIIKEYFEKLQQRRDAMHRVSTQNLPAVVVNPTLQNLLQCYEQKDKMQIAAFSKDLTLQKIVEEGGCSQISRLRKEAPLELTRLFKMMFLDFAKSFSINNNLTSEQVMEIIAEIQLNYWHLGLEDIAVFLKGIKSGEVGIVHTLDTNKMLTWLAAYDRKRLALIERKRNYEVPDFGQMERISTQIQIGELVKHSIARNLYKNNEL